MYTILWGRLDLQKELRSEAWTSCCPARMDMRLAKTQRHAILLEDMIAGAACVRVKFMQAELGHSVSEEQILIL